MNRVFWANVILCLILLGCLGYGVKRYVDAGSVVTLLQPKATLSATAQKLAGQVRLDHFQFDINQVTHDVQARFAITNHHAAAVYDIAIFCIFKDKNDELRGQGTWVVYDTLEPEHSQSFTITDKRFISYLVDPPRSQCTIVDVTPVDGGSAGHHEIKAKE